MNNKIIAMILVAIVVVAGVSAYVVLGNDNDEAKPVIDDATMTIFGNADGDYVIDETDLEVIQNIIDGKANAKDYPLADANDDGKVDQKDYAFVESMIKKTNKTVTVLDKSGAHVTLPYPLKTTVLVGTNILTTSLIIGAQDRIAGFSSTSYPAVHKPLLDNAELLGGTVMDFSTDGLQNFADLDAKVGVDAVITINTSSYLKKSADFISAAEIPILRIDPREGWDTVSDALIMGYIFGEECEKKSLEFAKMTASVLEYIDGKLNSVKDPARFLAVARGNWLSGVDSVYNSACTYAGGVPEAPDVPGTSVEIKEGDEAYKNYDPDFIVSFRTMDYSIDHVNLKGEVTTPADEWKSFEKYWEMFDCYEDGMFYVNLSMPFLAQIAYIAEMFYTDELGEGYGDRVHQEFVDKFMDYLGDDFDVSTDMTTIFTYNMIYP